MTLCVVHPAEENIKVLAALAFVCRRLEDISVSIVQELLNCWRKAGEPNSPQKLTTSSDSALVLIGEERGAPLLTPRYQITKR
ncbi:hypothetical protein AMECASPLE_005771 [Ameca splendens]|uniref:Uncharacterized protein n=1 Tax=Ameca splendens TaxID=208324 RepID=A0ABV0ZIZ6_9TELE